MSQRIALSQLLFYVALVLMLGNEILSATVLADAHLEMPVITLISALVALAARLWYHRLRRSAGSHDTCVDLGGYPLDLLRDPRFFWQHRTNA